MALRKFDDFDLWRAALTYELDQKGVNATEIAKKAGVGRTTLYNMVNGKRKTAPDITFLREISRAFGRTYEDFLTRGKQLIETGGADTDIPPFASITEEVYGVDSEGNPMLRQAAPAMGLIPSGYLEQFGLREEDVWLFFMNSRAMIPHIHPQQVLYINKQDVRVQSGGVYLIQLGDELTVRYLDSLPNGLRIRAGDPGIEPINLFGEDAKNLRILGRFFFQTGPGQ